MCSKIDVCDVLISLFFCYESCTACIYGQVLSQGFKIPSTSSISDRTQQFGWWISFRCQTKRQPGTFPSAHRTLVRDVSTKASRVGKT